MAGVIGGAVLLTFLPCLRCGFVNYDDDRYVYRNPLIRDFSRDGIARIFATTDFTVLYTPLVFLSYAVEYRFFGLDPFPYHLTNLILHLCNCLLVFYFILGLTRRASAAFITAILFGLHPLRVESVAWITERKDVLYALFLLASLNCYIAYARRGGPLRYLAAGGMFILALLAKPVSIVLPAIFLLCDYFLEGKIPRRRLAEKLPLFAVSAAWLVFGIVTAKGYVRGEPDFTGLDYFLIACYALLFYIYKSILPIGLSCMYPHPLKIGGVLPPIFLASPLILLALAALVVRSACRTRDVVFGSAFFFITAAPALRLFPPGLIIVADRYTYVPAIGLSFIAAQAVLWLSGREWRHAVAVAVAAMAASLSFLSRERCKVWRDSVTLWEDAVAKYRDSYIPVAYFNRGIVNFDIGRHEGAYADLGNALGLYYRRLGISGDGSADCGRMAAGGAGRAEVYRCFASKFAEIGKTQEAIACLNIASHADQGRSRY